MAANASEIKGSAVAATSTSGIGFGLPSSPIFTCTTCASVTVLRSMLLLITSTTTLVVIEVLPMRRVSVQKLTRSPTKTAREHDLVHRDSDYELQAMAVRFDGAGLVDVGEDHVAEIVPYALVSTRHHQHTLDSGKRPMLRGSL